MGRHRVSGLGQGLDHRRVQSLPQGFKQILQGQPLFPHQQGGLVQGGKNPVPYLGFLPCQGVQPRLGQLFLPGQGGLVGGNGLHIVKDRRQLPPQVFRLSQIFPQLAYRLHQGLPILLVGRGLVASPDEGQGQALAPGFVFHQIIGQRIGVVQFNISRAQQGQRVLRAKSLFNQTQGS